MVEPNAQSNRRGARLTAALVVAAFVAPIMVAWWFANVSPPDASQGRLNHGTLITPPLVVEKTPALAPLATIALGPGEWAMVYFTAGSCDAACAAGRSKLAQVFAVLGHDQTRVQSAAVLGDGAAAAAPGVIVDKALAAALANALAGEGGDGIVLLDWRGRLVIYFGDEQGPADIKKDLKRLLRASRIN